MHPEPPLDVLFRLVLCVDVVRVAAVWYSLGNYKILYVVSVDTWSVCC